MSRLVEECRAVLDGVRRAGRAGIGADDIPIVETSPSRRRLILHQLALFGFVRSVRTDGQKSWVALGPRPEEEHRLTATAGGVRERVRTLAREEGERRRRADEKAALKRPRAGRSGQRVPR